MIQITFVCLGNICRSPLAHTVMEELIKKAGLVKEIIVDSSGVGSWHVGKPSDARMRETALRHGYHITHRAQQFKSADGEIFQYIYAMDHSVYETILELLPKTYHAKVKLFRYLEEEGKDVPDPYYGGEQGFEEVFAIVSKNCHLILKDLINTYKLK